MGRLSEQRERSKYELDRIQQDLDSKAKDFKEEFGIEYSELKTPCKNEYDLYELNQQIKGMLNEMLKA